MILADTAFSKTFGLGVTFVGINVVVILIAIVIAVQVRGEYRQNREDRERLPDR